MPLRSRELDSNSRSHENHPKEMALGHQGEIMSPVLVSASLDTVFLTGNKRASPTRLLA